MVRLLSSRKLKVDLNTGIMKPNKEDKKKRDPITKLFHNLKGRF